MNFIYGNKCLIDDCQLHPKSKVEEAVDSDKDELDYESIIGRKLKAQI